MQYRESEQRQTEQDEARAVRVAMDELDLAHEEKLFDAARDEAVELVFKHRNPDAPGAVPGAPYAYPGLARKGSVQRSRSVEPKDQDLQRANSKLRKRHSIGSGASGSRSCSLQSNGGGNASEDTTKENAGFNSSPRTEAFETKDKSVEPSMLRKAISDLPDFRGRRKSSGSRRKVSGSLFSNPNDQIYEEPEEEAPVAPAPTPVTAEPPKPEKLPLGMRRNPFMRFQSIKGNPMTRSNTDPVLNNRRFDRYEIQKNPPTQSRNAAYTLNPALSAPVEDVKADVENEPEIKMKDGKEIRSDDLRAATGFRLRDRSPKLPTPTMVSDSPGRPIVSFNKGYNEIELKEDVYGSNETATRPASQATSGLRPLSHAVTSPVVPTIKSMEEDPKKSVPPVPTINIQEGRPKKASFGVPTINIMEDRPKKTFTPPPAEITVSPALSSRLNRFEKPTINVYEDPPTRPLARGAPKSFNNPAQPVAPARPTMNVYQAPSARTQSALPPSIPKICVSETPSISINAPAQSAAPARPTMNISQAASARSQSAAPPSIPSISVSSTPSISINGPPQPAAPSRPSMNMYQGPTARSHSAMPPSTVPSIGVTPPIPSISFSEAPAPSRGRNANVPSIAVTPDVPMIAVNGAPAPARGPRINAPSISVTPSVPTINVNGSGGSTRPLPDPKNHNSKPFGRGGNTNARTHWTPTTNARTGALCTHCALPIAGRIVSAAGNRFHPECFVCYQCGEHLECVAFYPEPDNKLADRVARIQARQRGEDIAFLPTHTTPHDMARLEHEDGTDESQRFFCHLDFHEMFSPRCKSCKTPIEGEVIVACGAEWHAGHFFCAQCGDPFDSSTPFVEKEGYAWCVNCHTHRFSTKCKKCRKPVTDTVVKALGAEWHVGCFCCVVSLRSFSNSLSRANQQQECSGPFQDGRYFLRGESQDPVCVKCEERRLKA
jgi:hypothetical protein